VQPVKKSAPINPKASVSDTQPNTEQRQRKGELSNVSPEKLEIQQQQQQYAAALFTNKHLMQYSTVEIAGFQP